jgi:hypothetical protein
MLKRLARLFHVHCWHSKDQRACHCDKREIIDYECCDCGHRITRSVGKQIDLGLYKAHYKRFAVRVGTFPGLSCPRILPKFFKYPYCAYVLVWRVFICFEF